MKYAIAILAALLAPLPAAAQAAKPANNSCVECHGPTDTILKKSTHYMVACAACHGGDIRVRKNLTEDEKKAKAHSADAPEPFVAVPEDKCFRCHKNETEAFHRGAHGLAMKSRRAATCKQCHALDPAAPSAHTILKFSFEEGGVPGRLRTGVDTAFVHRIGLFDAKIRLIDGKSPEPYSPMMTCGRCHDYPAISAGWHFQAGRHGTEDGRPGEPWILWDAATQTQLPLSYRSWAGARKPAEAGMTDWDVALRFGAHHPGGGVMEWVKDDKAAHHFEGGPVEWMKDKKRRDLSEEPAPDGKGNASKWKSGGAHAIDCLSCHLASPYNREERAAQVRSGQFRLAPEAALGLSALRPAVKKVTADGDEIYEPVSPAAKPPAGGAPVLVAIRDASCFDAEGRVLLDVTRHPPARNCQACHASRLPGSEVDRDVHLAAGLLCTDCHRNSIDHRIARGDGNGPLTCRGCHVSGGLGAPPIPHRGLPAFHLEKIACTTCHSGPWPDEELQAVQTARAHGLGLVAQEDLDGRALPAVRGPVYRPDGRGQIRPHYAVWPAWWGEKKEGKLVPLFLARVKEALEEVKKTAPDAGAEVLLAKLKEKGVAEPVRVAGGRVYRLEGGAVASSEAPEAGAVMWPIGHEVRPAPQALGATGCSDCHSNSSPFFFGKVAAAPAGPDGRSAEKRMNEHLGMGAAAIRLGAMAVVMREGGMKLIAVILVLGLLAAGLGHMTLSARFASWLGIPAVRAAGPAPDLCLPLRWVHFCAWGLVLALIATGAGFLVTYGPSPLPTFFSSRHAVRLHVAAGLVFAVLAPALAAAWIVLGVVKKRGADWVNAWGGFLWMARGRGEGKIAGWDRLWIWFDLACALAVAATGLVMAMRVPAVGHLAGEALRRLPDNHLLGPLAYAVHGMAGAALIGRLACHLYALLFLRKRA